MQRSDDLPIWRHVETCAHELTRRRAAPFSRQDLISCVLERAPHSSANTINAVIQGLTDNLKGGAPGAVGKDILHSVGRGQFVLKRASIIKTAPNAGRQRSELADQKTSGANQELPSTEGEVRNRVMRRLHRALGSTANWSGEGSTLAFRMAPTIECAAEKKLKYTLPNGIVLAHASDILVSDTKSDRHVSIEIKYRSAVTDQFKCRAYDMQHLKQQYGTNLLGLMLYVKADTGISIKQAKAICHVFDRFVAVPVRELHDAASMDPVVSEISAFFQLGV